MKVTLGVSLGILALLMVAAPGTMAQTSEELGFEAGVDANGKPAGFPNSGVYGEAQITVLSDATKARTGSGVLEVRAVAGSAGNSQAYLIRQRGPNADGEELWPDGTELTISAWFNVNGLDPSTAAQVWVYQYGPNVMLLDYSVGDSVGAASNGAGWVQASHTMIVGVDKMGEPFGPNYPTERVGMRPCHAYLFEDGNVDGQDAVILVDDVTIDAGGASSVEGDWALYE